VEDRKVLGSSDVFGALRPQELGRRLELQQGTGCLINSYADCGCGFVGCCPYWSWGIICS